MQTATVADREPRPTPFEWIFWFVVVFGTTTGYTSLTGPNVSERIVWLIGDAAALVFLLRDPDRYTPHIKRHLILFMWPALALLSAVWSLTPGLSAYHALQLFGTLLVGVVLVVRLGLLGVAKLLFVVLLVGMIASYPVALSGSRPGPRGEWIGIYTDKNTFGALSVMLVYTGLVLAWARWLRLPALGAVPIAIPLLIGSESATSALALSVVAFLPLVIARRVGWQAFAFTAILIAAVAVVATGFILFSGTNLAASILDALGKDSSLTGRTSLWSFGTETFYEHPILGLGYKAYWESAETSSGYLRYFVQQHLWFFHNNFLEIAVALGVVGLALFLAGLGWSVAVVAGAVLARPNPATAWALMGLSHILILCFVENPLFFNHSFTQLVFMMLVVGAAAEARGPVNSPARTAPAAAAHRRGAAGPATAYGP